MFGNYTYIIWLIIFIGLPLLALLRWHHLLGKQRRALALATFGALVGGWAWDVIAVRFGAWYYDPKHIFGLWYFGLPIEEWLWIVGTTLLFGSLAVILAERKVKSDK